MEDLKNTLAVPRPSEDKDIKYPSQNPNLLGTSSRSFK